MSPFVCWALGHHFPLYRECPHFSLHCLYYRAILPTLWTITFICRAVLLKNCLIKAPLLSSDRPDFFQVIAAEGELNASRCLKDASEVLAESPQALQLRYLQTLQMISTDRSSTIVFPIPMDILPDAMHMSRKWDKMNAALDYTFLIRVRFKY